MKERVIQKQPNWGEKINQSIDQSIDERTVGRQRSLKQSNDPILSTLTAFFHEAKMHPTVGHVSRDFQAFQEIFRDVGWLEHRK